MTRGTRSVYNPLDDIEKEATLSTAHEHHIQIGDTPWCDWTGCQAGIEINAQAGGVLCGHTSAADAERGAQALRSHFKAGTVKVVAGPCSHVVEA